MNNYTKQEIFSLIFALIFIILFFYNPSAMCGGVKDGLLLCGQIVVPSLFPFIVLSDYIIRSGAVLFIGKVANKATQRLFNLPGSAAGVILLSLVGGFPIGAKMTAQLIDSDELSEEQGKRMMLFCVNAGPAFVIGSVGVSMLSSKKAGIILYISLTFSSLIMGMLSHLIADEKPIKKVTPKELNQSGSLIKSISESANVTVNICAWILAFSALNGMLTSFSLPDSAQRWLCILCEVTNGCIKSVGAFPTCVLALVIGWSGLAVHCQIYPFMKKTNIRFFEFLVGRIIVGALATAIAWLLFQLFPCEIQTAVSVTKTVFRPFSVSVSAAVSTFILCGISIIDSVKKES